MDVDDVINVLDELKNVIIAQREYITDLEEENENLTEYIRLLTTNE